MKTLKNILTLFLLLMVVMLGVQCTSVPKLEKETPSTIKLAYYQQWNAGLKEGGSGINIYIEVTDSCAVLDSIYFRGKVSQLNRNSKNDLLYVGRFKSQINSTTNSSNQSEMRLFQIKNNECVISYLEGQMTHYFKVSHIEERKPISYPSTSSNKL